MSQHQPDRKAKRFAKSPSGRGASWPRSFALLLSKRVLRLTATPHAHRRRRCSRRVCILHARSSGLHFVHGIRCLPGCLRGNLIAAALGTAAGNPLTFPLIWRRRPGRSARADSRTGDSASCKRQDSACIRAESAGSAHEFWLDVGTGASSRWPSARCRWALLFAAVHLWMVRWSRCAASANIAA